MLTTQRSCPAAEISAGGSSVIAANEKISHATAGAGHITSDLGTTKLQPGRDHLEFRSPVTADPDVGKSARTKVARVVTRLIAPMPLARRAQMPARGLERRLASPGFMSMEGVPTRREIRELTVNEDATRQIEPVSRFRRPGPSGP